MQRFSILFFLASIPIHQGLGQIVYFEDFGTGCTTGTLATTFGWVLTSTGTNEITANTWYVSADENGVGSGNCGIGCGGANSRTLHVGAHLDAGGDLGAAYFESSAFFCAFLGLCSATDKRIQSPTINCTGISTITLSFDYIENGEGTADNATVWYSADNGTTWIQIDDPPKTSLCGAQGLWTSRSLTLPASADNNATVKIGFRWVNDANGTATDPSFAVDNIQVGLPVILAAEMLNMTVSCTGFENSISWKTENELNTDYYAVYKSTDGVTWALLGQTQAINGSGPNHYVITDKLRTAGISYYYIEQVDFDGKRKSYQQLSSENCQPESDLSIYPNPSDGSTVTLYSGKQDILQAGLFSMDGKLIAVYTNDTNAHPFQLNLNLPSGTYLVKVLTTSGVKVLPLIISSGGQPANH
ncbi:MAG: T9SS type A sorting domain-containing protein [Bacteroidetes bacterium]|nr:T9SS type A sorting domain-containing protein [Bacteroidota bacterium]